MRSIRKITSLTSKKRKPVITMLVVSASVLGTGAALAADTDSPAVPTPTAATTTPAANATTKAPEARTTVKPAAGLDAVDHMAEGRAALARSDWKAAITAFTLAVEENPQNADANNMLAYSYRKSGDLKSAFRYYAIALKIDPKHKGALEYQGEAYVQAGEIAKAKANLAKLQSICGKTCEEYKDLAAFIAKAPKTKTTKMK